MKPAIGIVRVIRFRPGFWMTLLLAGLFAAGGHSADQVVDFEGPGETKSGYEAAVVTLSGLDWELRQVLIGTHANDWRNGARSARLQGGQPDAALTLLQDLTNGLGVVSFKFRRFGSDAQAAWQVETSSDGGQSWQPAGGMFAAADDDNVQTFREAVSLHPPVRIRIVRAGDPGVTHARLNIDDLFLTPHPPLADAPLVTTDPVRACSPTSACAEGTVIDDRGKPIASRGIQYQRAELPIESGETVDAAVAETGVFEVVLTGLTPGETYHLRAYAAHADGIGYGDSRVFRAACFTHPPVALEAADVLDGERFTARWTAVEGAIGYRLQVATNALFVMPGLSRRFRETLGSTPETRSLEAHGALGGFDSSGLVPGDGGIGQAADVRATLTSDGYVDPEGMPASGGANLFFSGTDGAFGFSLGGIDTHGYRDLRLGFGYRKESAQRNADFQVEWSADQGSTWQALALAGLPSEDAGTGWFWIGDLLLPEGAENQAALMVRWVKHGTVSMRIDDLLLRGDGGAGSLVPGYEDLAVDGLEQVVTNMTPGRYAYRVAAVGGGDCRSSPSAPMIVELVDPNLPRVETEWASALGAGTAEAAGRVVSDGGHAVTARGFCWCVGPAPPTIADKTQAAPEGGTGGFTLILGDLVAGQTYVLRAYAVNAHGIAYGSSLSLSMPCFDGAPVLLPAADLTPTGFTIRWLPLSGAAGYALDVSSSPSFDREIWVAGVHAAHDGTLGAAGWIEDGVGQGAASGNDYLLLLDSQAALVSPPMRIRGEGADADLLTFQARTYGGVSGGSAVITISRSLDDGQSWQDIATREPTGTTLLDMDPVALGEPAGEAVRIRLQARDAGSGRGVGLDAVRIDGLTAATEPCYLPGYAARSIDGTRETLGGLQTGKPYFYRVRAVGGDDCPFSAYSATHERIPPAATLLRLQ